LTFVYAQLEAGNFSVNFSVYDKKLIRFEVGSLDLKPN